MRRTTLSMVWVLATVSLLAAPCQGADYVAMIMDLKNGSVAYAEGPLEGKPVQVMEFLYESDTLKVSDGATLVLNYFDSARREEVRGPAVIRVTRTKSEAVGGGGGIQQEKLAYLPPKSDIDNMYAQNFGNVSFRAGVKRDDSAGRDRMLVFSLWETSIRPGVDAVLEWRAVAGADGYRATLLGKNDQVLEEIRTRETRAGFAAAGIKPRQRYAWRLEALQGGEATRTVEGNFTVLSSARAQAVERAQNSIRARFPADSTEALTALNLLYQGHDLRDEAVGVLMTLNKRFPDNEMVKNQLRSLNPALLRP